LKPVISNKTIFRLQAITGEPVSRGLDKTINTVLDQLESRNVDQTERNKNSEDVVCECSEESNEGD